MSDTEMIIDNPPVIALDKGKASAVSTLGKVDDSLPWYDRHPEGLYSTPNNSTGSKSTDRVA
jgi:hypothetical protein